MVYIYGNAVWMGRNSSSGAKKHGSISNNIQTNPVSRVFTVHTRLNHLANIFDCDLKMNSC